MLQVIEKRCRKYTLLLLKYKSEYKNKNCDSKVAVQFVQTCLPEIKLFEHQLVSLAERKKKNIFRETLWMTNLHH